MGISTFQIGGRNKKGQNYHHHIKPMFQNQGIATNTSIIYTFYVLIPICTVTVKVLQCLSFLVCKLVIFSSSFTKCCKRIHCILLQHLVKKKSARKDKLYK